jgi:transcriptional regulator with XRE-family HTH domain
MPVRPEMLRAMRLKRKLTLKQVAARVGLSPAQIQRLEKGERRMTIDLLAAYCAALRISATELIRGEVQVPIIGIVDAQSNILALPAGSAEWTRVPYLVAEPSRLGAVRWETRDRFELMNGAVEFFYADVPGIAPNAWNRRCIIRRGDGTQRIGWLLSKDGQTHVSDNLGGVEFNLQVEWASPILAMLAPEILAEGAERFRV